MKSSSPKNNRKATHAWLLLSIAGKRQYAGNTGYADIPGEVYRYDSYVPNARHLAVSDVVIFRDRRGAYGFATIQRIDSSEGTKEVLRCPTCGVAQIKERTSKAPRFLCRNKHTFDDPAKVVRDCIKYDAHFGDSYISAESPIPPAALRGACTKFNGQLSIQRVSLDILAPFIDQHAPFAMRQLQIPRKTVEPFDASSSPEHSTFVPIEPSAIERISAQIKARRGQQRFRDSLLALYGNRCVVSGCELVDVLEAAHIYPYRSPHDNHPSNGLLLRCDLHTLFDLDLMGIEPASLCVRLHPSAIRHGYSEFDGRPLQCGALQLSSDALEFRWQLFCLKLALPSK